MLHLTSQKMRGPFCSARPSLQYIPWVTCGQIPQSKTAPFREDLSVHGALCQQKTFDQGLFSNSWRQYPEAFYLENDATVSPWKHPTEGSGTKNCSSAGKLPNSGSGSRRCICRTKWLQKPTHLKPNSLWIFGQRHPWCGDTCKIVTHPHNSKVGNHTMSHSANSDHYDIQTILIYEY